MGKPILITLSLILAFIATAFFIPPDPMNEVLSGGVFIAAGFGLYRWGPAAWRNYIAGAKDETAWGLIGLVLLLVSLSLQRVYSTVYINLGRPDYLMTLHIAPFLVYTTLIALVLFVAATSFPGERPNRINTLVAAIVSVLGISFSTIGPTLIGKIGLLMSKLLLVFH